MIMYVFQLVINGFTDNDTIIFKIWDHVNQKEMLAKAITYHNDISIWTTSGKSNERNF